MKLEFDDDNNETVVRMNAKERGALIFAIDMAMYGSLTTRNRNELTQLRLELTAGVSEPEMQLDRLKATLDNYWENPR